MIYIKALILFVFSMSMAQAIEVTKCGTYKLEGYLKKRKKGNLMLLLNKNAESQIKVIFDEKYNKNQHQYLINSNVILFANFEKACRFKCYAKLVNIRSRLHPMKDPKTFGFPTPKPTTPQKCRK